MFMPSLHRALLPSQVIKTATKAVLATLNEADTAQVGLAMLTRQTCPTARFILIETLVQNGTAGGMVRMAPPVEWHRQLVLGSLLGGNVYRDTFHP